MKTWLVVCGVIVFVIFGIAYIASTQTYRSTNEWAQPVYTKIDPGIQAFCGIFAVLGAILTAAGLAANTTVNERCPRCGLRVAEGAAFCESCGFRL